MEMIQRLADYSIRRALSFAGLGAVTLMLALSSDLPLALRTGGNIMALVCLGLLWAAWRTPRRNLRRSELWFLLLHHAGALVHSMTQAEAQRLMAQTLRQRLVWHAEQVGTVALALWVLSLLLGLVIA